MDLEAIQQEIDAAPLDTPEAVDAFRVRYLGRKNGIVRSLFTQMGDVAPEARRAFGQSVNALKARVEARLEEAAERLNRQAGDEAPDIDLTLPGRAAFAGSIHPLTQTLDEIKRVFRHFGFDVAEGPEIEDDWHNFTALNFPPDHPARDMQDTLFVREGSHEGADDAVVMRTHTSPVQIRVMKEQAPPLRVIVPGRVYRNEALSYKSFCLFHQVEGLVVDEHTTFADLKAILHVFAQTLFGDDVVMRFRPSFFPFTEPSAEVDIWWPEPDPSTGSGGTGGGKWLEILGCGMVDPNVLRAVDIDPERYTGYAFGMGVERIALLRYDIEDIRLFYENDIRFLEQF